MTLLRRVASVKKIVLIICMAVLWAVVMTGCSKSVAETPPVVNQQEALSEAPQTLEPESVETPQNNVHSDSTPVSNDATIVPYDPDKYLTDDELVFGGGVRLEMSYEEVVGILGDYDESYDNAPGVKSVLKNGVHYGFYENDGVFRLKSVNLSESSKEIFPRGIKVGDKIEDVLNKFPGNDKTLRKWAVQKIYGEDHMEGHYANLEFRMYDECYHLVVKTPKAMMAVNFDRNNCVRFIEVYGEGM